MRPRCSLWWTMLATALVMSTAADAQLYPDLERFRGAWVPEGAACESVFFRQGDAIKFRRPGATRREGILITGRNEIEDARHRCRIFNITQATDDHEMLVRCLSGPDRRLSFSLRFVDEDTIARSPTGSPGERVRFRRCRL